jgi:hypothetical protein
MTKFCGHWCSKERARHRNAARIEPRLLYDLARGGCIFRSRKARGSPIWAEGETVVHRVQKFIEAGSGRIGYALTAAALSDASNGASWKPDPSFNVADSILDDPEFVSVLKVVLRHGHVIVPALEPKGK